MVGLTTIHVLGFDRPAALQLAEKCGVAFQLTNIMRDVSEDAGLGRVYLRKTSNVSDSPAAKSWKAPSSRRTSDFVN